VVVHGGDVPVGTDRLRALARAATPAHTVVELEVTGAPSASGGPA
jgi:hypothetical protein